MNSKELKAKLVYEGIFDGLEYKGTVIEYSPSCIVASIHGLPPVGAQEVFTPTPSMQIFSDWDTAVEFVESEWNELFGDK